MKKVRLALSGSGFLAPIHAGAICAFQDAGVEIVEVAGTSGGSIAAALLGAGLSGAQIRALAFEPLPSGIMSWQVTALFSQGYNSGNVLHDWLHRQIGPISFRDAKVPVTIIATSIDMTAVFEMSKELSPFVMLGDACRASCSVPFIYSPFDIQGAKLVDGGVWCNIPVDFLTEDDIPRVGIEVSDGATAATTNNIIDFAKQCINTLLTSNEANLTKWAKETGTDVLLVNSKPHGFLDPKLSAEAKLELFNRGYNTVQAYLKGH